VERVQPLVKRGTPQSILPGSVCVGGLKRRVVLEEQFKSATKGRNKNVVENWKEKGGHCSTEAQTNWTIKGDRLHKNNLGKGKMLQTTSGRNMIRRSRKKEGETGMRGGSH